jgi:hypothetical protein
MQGAATKFEFLILALDTKPQKVGTNEEIG